MYLKLSDVKKGELNYFKLFVRSAEETYVVVGMWSEDWGDNQLTR